MDATAAATLFAWLDREIWLISAVADGHRNGLIATSVSQESIVPELPRVLVSLARHHYTTELIESSHQFALHLLGADNLELVWKFGLESGRERDKFSDLDVGTTMTGCPLIRETVGWLDCKVEARLDAGDRFIYVAEVLQGQVLNFAPPLTTRRLMELAPISRLTQLQRSRHHQSYQEAELIRLWREQRRNG